MGEQLRITVSPANRPEYEEVVDRDDWPNLDELAQYGREKWFNHTSADVELHVAIEKVEWKETGRYGSGEAEQEAEMIRRAMEEAEKS